MSERRLLLFGGAFNPPHQTHRRVLRQAMAAVGAERALVLPVGRHPLKEDTGLAPDQARLELCRIAFADLPGVEVDDLDLDRDGPSYTVDTLELLRTRFPEHALFWLVGADNLHILDQWRDHHRLLRLCTLVIYPRLGFPIEREVLTRQDLTAGEIDRLLAHVLEVPADAVSATAIRDALRAGRRPNDVAPAVLARIHDLGLYRP